MNPFVERRYSCPVELAKQFPIPADTWRKWFHEGRLKGATKYGRRILIPLDSVQAMMTPAANDDSGEMSIEEAMRINSLSLAEAMEELPSLSEEEQRWLGSQGRWRDSGRAAR